MKKIIFAVLVLCTILCFSVSAEIVDSGICGENSVWSLDEDGTLNISGSGSIEFDSCPWLSNAENVKKVVVENGITSICDHAFFHCKNLEEIYISESVSKIGEWGIFGGVFPPQESLLDTIVVSGNSEYFSAVDNVLFNKEQTELIYYPLGKTETYYKIPDSVNVLRCCAFRFQPHLETVYIPEYVTKIEDDAFNCKNLKTVEYGGTEVDWINIDIYKDNKDYGLEGVDIEYNSLYGLFDDKETSWRFDDGVLYVSGNGVFSENLEMSGRDDIFYVVIEEGVTGIDDCWFNDCINLKSIKIPSTVKTINGTPMLWNIPEIDFDDNDNFVFENGVLFDKNKEQLVWYNKNIEDSEYMVPEGVTTICSFAFYGNEFVENLVIPASVININDSGIRNCKNLKTISYMGSQEEWENITTRAFFAEYISGINVVFDYIPETNTNENPSEIAVNSEEDDKLVLLDDGIKEVSQADVDSDNSYEFIIVLTCSAVVILAVAIIIFFKKKSKKNN